MAVMYRNWVAILIATAWLGQFVLWNSSRLLGAEDNVSWLVKDGRTMTVLDATYQKSAKNGVFRRTTPGSFVFDAARVESAQVRDVCSRTKRRGIV